MCAQKYLIRAAEDLEIIFLNKLNKKIVHREKRVLLVLDSTSSPDLEIVTVHLLCLPTRFKQYPLEGVLARRIYCLKN